MFVCNIIWLIFLMHYFFSILCICIRFSLCHSSNDKYSNNIIQYFQNRWMSCCHCSWSFSGLWMLPLNACQTSRDISDPWLLDKEDLTEERLLTIQLDFLHNLYNPRVNVLPKPLATWKWRWDRNIPKWPKISVSSIFWTNALMFSECH